MEAKDTVKQIALDVFGTNDGIRPRFPRRGEKMQEAMEISFKAGKQEGIREVVEWIQENTVSFNGVSTQCRYLWQAKRKEWGME